MFQKRTIYGFNLASTRFYHIVVWIDNFVLHNTQISYRDCTSAVMARQWIQVAPMYKIADFSQIK
jgi:hypothetical protein